MIIFTKQPGEVLCIEIASDEPTELLQRDELLIWYCAEETTVMF